MAKQQQDVLADRRIMVGVTGGIAAYKTAALVSTLVQRGAAVRVAMTEAATKFVGPMTFQALTNKPVHVDMWSATTSWHDNHIGLADWVELCVVAPATADIIGKMACGLADDLLSTTLLTLTVPIVIAPAMNVRMWQNPVVQDNVARLKKLGYNFVGPESGRLACGDTGPGRMSEPEKIIAALEGLLRR